MTAKLHAKEVISPLPNMGGGKQALAIPITEMSALAWAQLFLLPQGTGLKVLLGYISLYACMQAHASDMQW